MTSRNFILLASLFGFLGVAFGAFGAHALAARFAEHPTREATFHTAVHYQMIHALALIGAAWLLERAPSRVARWAGILFAVGTILFSGSLTILSVFEVRMMGAVAPLGGLALLGGWVCLGIAAWRTPAKV